MKKSKTESAGGSKKCSEKATYNISQDGTVFSMVSRLENSKNNLCSKNIFKIYKIDENSDCTRFSDKGKNIKIFIKNENNITNYNCARDIPEPIIMNHKNCPTNKTNVKTSQFSCEKRNSFPCNAPTSQPYCGFLRKKFDSEVKNLPSFLTHREHAPILPRRKATKKMEEFTSIDSLMEESFLMSDDAEIEPSNYFTKQSQDHAADNRLNDKPVKNLFSSKQLLTRPKFIPRYNKQVQTESKVPKKYSLERKDAVKSVNHTIFPKINEKNQESSNFSLFKSMNSNELAHICEPEGENAHFNNGIFYPENKEDNLICKEDKSQHESDDIDISKVCKNDNTSFDKSSFQTQSLTNLVESRAFEEEKDNDLNESTTFINYTHSFEIDESQDDQTTYPSTTD
ncbi:hypothetical protein BpHYR1_044197 [Brachionus plicatilis]|uniref:Uncharacterized protein n=1 Tax=Brachionus plicatilis TaxID=10195 RepID=A0A3M7PAR3_BRAPC|nr:hypothetical protein BpHYR1_044197 [Brachionus plicatilis]